MLSKVEVGMSTLAKWGEEIPLDQVLEVDRVGETQVKGLFLQESITYVTGSEDVAMKSRVWQLDGTAARIVTSWPSYTPTGRIIFRIRTN